MDGHIDFQMLHASIVTVTPELAQFWLDRRNTHNRKLKKSRWPGYARDMADGRWKFNGDSLKFSREGVLLDGQNRLLAQIKSGLTLKHVLVTGLDPDSQDTMDRQASRTVADDVRLQYQHPNPKGMAAVARRVLKFDRGFIHDSGEGAPTHPEQMEFIRDNFQEVELAADLARQVQVSQAELPVAPSVVGSMYFVCRRISRGAAELFYHEQLVHGRGLDDGYPALILRRRLQREKQSTSRPMNPEDAIRYTAVAWNHFRAGNSIYKLQTPRGGWPPGKPDLK